MSESLPELPKQWIEGLVPTRITSYNVCYTKLLRWQHMTTFTLGLGVRGRMIYSPTYKTDTSGDYFDVSQGSTASSSVCIWQPPNADPRVGKLLAKHVLRYLERDAAP